MAEIPRAVLSEQLQECMKGRRLLSAVFLTYKFDPGFFEQEVLPVLLDVPLSHATAIRLVQLEDVLRSLPGQIAVYFDANGIVTDAGSAKLDVRRIPVQHRTGIFHPKNVFLLVEDEGPAKETPPVRTLIVAAMSANLTRAGWWENVEVCHVEQITEDERTPLRDDLAIFLTGLRRRAVSGAEHAALDDMLALLRNTEQRVKRSVHGHLLTRFYAGRESVADFLERVAGAHLQNTCLEIISPYFDDASDSPPLTALRERFHPKEVRVFLPRAATGEGLCRKELYDSVRAIPGVRWGLLPKDFLRLGPSADAGERFVHAKVYRFFTQTPKREIYFVGSVNLTSAAHQFGGNVESGFLVDLIPSRRPEFWQSPDDHKPTEFRVQTEDEGRIGGGGSRLVLRYHWDSNCAEAFWDDSTVSPLLRLEARGIELGHAGPLAARNWADLGSDFAGRLRLILDETSLVTVMGDGERPTILLVQEEGMSHKPSLFMRLSVADILRYWSLLKPEQRAAFLEARAPELAIGSQGTDLVTRARLVPDGESLFDRFAGIFHAFSCLERSVREALDENNRREATYRLFGKKYDSLGSLLDKVVSDKDAGDTVDQYVTILCARQLCRAIATSYPDFWHDHRSDAKELQARFEGGAAIRKRLVVKDPKSMPGFLDWFDSWFLRRAEPLGIDS